MDAPNPAPPVARTIPVVRSMHGDTFVDDYAWLKERDDPAVRAYLDAENAYTEAMTGHTGDLQETLYKELVGRIKETDVSAPVPDGDWFYYQRTEEGLQYPIYCRKFGGIDAAEQVILDQNVLAEGHSHFQLGALAASPDHSLLAFSIDTTGSERYTLMVKNLSTGELLADRIEGVQYTVVWANDNATVLYTTMDDAQRPDKLWRHVLGTPQSDDELILHEPDQAFYVQGLATKTKRFILVSVSSTVTSEWHVIDAADPVSPPRLVEARRPGVEYWVTHQGDRFVIASNEDGATDFALYEAPDTAPTRENWRLILAHRPGIKIEAAEPFADWLVLTEREQGLLRFRVESMRDGAIHRIDMPESVYTASPGANRIFDAGVFRFNYASMVTPASVYDYDMATHTLTLVKQQEVLGGFDPARYETDRVWATAADGALIPICLLRERGAPRDGSRPLMLYGYGSYGASMDPAFSPHRFTLVDRGFTYAIAQPRGGGELGESWRNDGKLAKKMNTFTDFVACAEYLIAEGFTSSARLAANGGSAGGLLMGAIANLRPDLFAAIVAQVPFVDVINTILDPNLLFSVLEYDEWGNPNLAEQYAWMRAYSPYENVEAKVYPHLLVTAGLNDPRVNYWEPAKWVARLRATKTGGNRLLLKTKMDSGHGGASGRYDYLRDEAFKYAFVLDTLGIANDDD